MSDEALDLDAIKRRLAATEPGEWQWSEILIRHAREDIAALIEEVERLRQELIDAGAAPQNVLPGQVRCSKCGGFGTWYHGNGDRGGNCQACGGSGSVKP